MFIYNVTKIIFRSGDFVAITREPSPLRLATTKNSIFRYGHSRKFNRGIYTFKYKNITAFYSLDDKSKHFLVVELNKEKYLFHILSKKDRDIYLEDFKKAIKSWGS